MSVATTAVPASPQSVVDQVRGIDGVASARGFVQGYAQLIGRDGEAVDKGVSSTGVTFVGGRARGPMLLVDDGGTRSRGPRGADELAIDLDTAVDAGSASATPSTCCRPARGGRSTWWVCSGSATPTGRSPRASARHTRWAGSGLSASLRTNSIELLASLIIRFGS